MLFGVECGDFDNGGNGFPNFHRGTKLERLGHINRARPGELRAQHLGNQARRQHPMGDAFLEDGGGSIFRIQMHGVGIAGDGGEQHDIGFRDGFGKFGGQPHRQVFEEIDFRHGSNPSCAALRSGWIEHFTDG